MVCFKTVTDACLTKNEIASSFDSSQRQKMDNFPAQMSHYHWTVGSIPAGAKQRIWAPMADNE